MSLVRRPLTALSGGQRQRALLVLDWVSTGLDPSSRRLIDDVMRAAAARGSAIVHASHDAESIDAADAVLELWTVDR